MQNSFGTSALDDPAALWTYSAVDTVGNTGVTPSITAVNTETIFISYQNSTDSSLKFAKTTDGGDNWDTSVVAGSNIGPPTSITAADTNTIFIANRHTPSLSLWVAYSTDGGINWNNRSIDTQTDVGWFSSIIAVDANNVFMSYNREQTDELKFAKSTDGGYNWDWIVVDTDGDVGQTTSIDAVDTSTIFISYRHRGNNDLKFAKSTDSGSTWNYTYVDTVGDVGQTNSIKSLDANTILISYWDATNSDLKLAKTTDGGSNWNLSYVDTVGAIGVYNSLSVLDANNLFIAYRDIDNTGLKFARTTDGGSNWTFETIDTTNIGISTSELTMVNTSAYIAYRDNTNFHLKFAKYVSTINSEGGTFVPIISESIVLNKEALISEELKGRFEEGGYYEGYNTITGGFSSEVHPVDIGTIFKAWCGASSSTLVSSVYQHVFNPVNVDFDDMAAVPPLTVEVYREAGSAFLYYDMLCDKITLDYSHGALTKCAVELIGGKFQTSNKVTPTYLEGEYYQWDTTSISLGGNAATTISNLSLSFSNGLSNVGTLDGTRTPNRTKRSGFRTLEISGVLLFEDMTEFDNFRNQTSQQMIINTTGETIGNAVNAIKIDIPRMRYVSFSAPMQNKGLVQANFSAKAEYDETSSYLLEITLTNTKDSY